VLPNGANYCIILLKEGGFVLFRKKELDIIKWIDHSDSALLITGARQTGKTFIIRETLKKQNCNFIEFNFIAQPEIIEILDKSTNIDNFILRLSVISKKKLITGETIIFFDEVQEYKEIVTKIKFLIEEGSFKYILSGSLLGVELVDLRSAPVGYLSIIDLYPMDFEEFLYALKIQKSVIDNLKNSFDNKTPIDEFIHKKIMETFHLYLLVGGMPKAVQTYIDSNNMEDISLIHNNIISLYKKDFTKYEKNNKLKLQEIYDLIPAELDSKNKRFKLVEINKELKFERYENNFLWLKDAGVALPVYNISEPKIPLLLSSKRNLFKLFLSDIGLLTSLYGSSTKIKILNQENSINSGAIFENVVAQELCAHGFKTYYFNSKKQGELDFVIEYNGKCLPLEIKSGKDFIRHSALDNVLKDINYQIAEAFVLSNSNVIIQNNIVYYPIYMIMFIENDSSNIKLKKIDLSKI
jgi:predicted AAA+ superfamily ATPase